jgi:hypothetical protein
VSAAEIPQLPRWRLVLGEAANDALGGAGLSDDTLAMDAALSWLYSRDKALAERDILERSGGRGASTLSVPDWIGEIHRLFPKETIERLERDAVERFQIDEVVTNPAVLERIEPNEVLLQAVLRTKHLMNPEVLQLARRLVAEVVRKLIEKLAREIRQSFTGAINRRRRSPLRIAHNLDFRRTLKANLQNWSPTEQKIFLEKPHFFARTRRFAQPWQIVLLVDQTHHTSDPVELLMRVQLGGGTDIQQAVAYATGLLEAPRRSIVVLISDFFEGASAEQLLRRVKALCDQGTHVLGLAALDEQANPSFDRDLAQRLVQVGAHIGAMTPGELATWIAEKVRA